MTLSAESTVPGAVSARSDAGEGPRCVGEIERRRGLTPEEFDREYFRPRKPVILQGLMDDWRAMREWSIEFFRRNYADVDVPVGRCFKNWRRMPLGEYIDMMEDLKAEAQAPGAFPPMYMEGWYYMESRPELCEQYTVPPHFDVDLFNTKRFPFEVKPEAWGILIGPKGAFTKLHYDLWATHSWNAQLVGRKRWILIPPEQRKYCYLETRQNQGYVPGTDIKNPNLDEYPLLRKVTYTEAIVEPGEMIFFPSLTLHEVVSLDDSISITHNYLTPNIWWRVLGRYMAHRYLKKQAI